MGGRGASSSTARGGVTIAEKARRDFLAENPEVRDVLAGRSNIENAPIMERVPEWFLEENIDFNRRYALEKWNDGGVVKGETEKAVLVRAGTDFGDVSLWVPKSILRNADTERKDAEAVVRRGVGEKVRGMYHTYLKGVAKQTKTKVPRTKKAWKLDKALTDAGVKHLSKDEFANSRYRP